MTEPISHPFPTLINSAVKNITIEDAPWEEYQRPYVRDLAYSLACPNVLTKWIDFAPNKNSATITVHSSDFWQAQYEAYCARLVELDTTNAYQDLTRYLLARQSPNRLGFHFEGLLSFWLSDGYALGLHPYEIVASNVQLFRGKQTTGELDLVLYNHKEKLTEHWELAIKFFMGSAPFAPENWVGINSNDNLKRKMTHMQNKQFCTVSVDTKNHGHVGIDKRYAVIKGRFFLPSTITDFIYPDWLVQSFPMHRWLAVLNSQNNRDDQPNSEIIQKQNQVSSIESIIEPLDGITGIRRAHYIEWFTQRDFYNSNCIEHNKTDAREDGEDVNKDDMLSNHQALPQGLYFIQVNTNQKRSSQTYYEPLVILQTNKDDGHDSLSN